MNSTLRYENNNMAQFLKIAHFCVQYLCMKKNIVMFLMLLFFSINNHNSALAFGTFGKLNSSQPQIVSIDSIGVFGIRNLIKNTSAKLRVINIWATWCGPCVSEFPDFVKINKKFRDRNFEWVTLSADPPNKQSKVLKFLQKKQGIGTNYIFNSEDLYQLIETVDPRWRGAIPYTLIVAPGGKILYAQPGVIDPVEITEIIEGAFR
jgi:thiol-disulfide isomerase/thioredoxin